MRDQPGSGPPVGEQTGPEQRLPDRAGSGSPGRGPLRSGLSRDVPRPRLPVRDLLVVELLGGLGDVVLVLPAVHALARAHPSARIRVLTFPPGDTLLTADPQIAEVVTAPAGRAREAVAAELARPTDLVVSTTSYDGIRELVSATVPGSVADLWRRPPPDELVDVRFLRLLAADGLIDPADVGLLPSVVLTPEERAAGSDLLADLTGGGAGPAVLLPGSGMAVKRWPAARWRELAAGLSDSGRAVLVPSTGDPVESTLGAHELPRLELRALAAVFAAAGERRGVVVGGDTGPLRLAAAVGAPVVGLFGPTLAARYGLRGPVAASLQGLPGCEVRRPTTITEQECWWSGHCPLSGGDPACLADVGVAAVLRAVGAVTASAPGRG